MSHKTIFFIFAFISLLVFSTTSAQETATPTLLISEIAYDTWRDDALNEWIELLVVSETPIDAGQIKLGDEEEIGGGEGMKRFPKETIFEPGELIVVAQSAVDFRNVYGVYPSFELLDSTADVPNMINVSLLAKGDVALSNAGDEVIILDERNRPIDRVSYGESTVYLNPAIDSVEAGWSLERVPPNCDRDLAADFRPQKEPNPFKMPKLGDCPTAQAKATPTLEKGDFSSGDIGAIQGERTTAAKVDQTVTFEGVVTAITADKNASGTTFYTLFVQDTGDGNAKTSDAIPVFNNRSRPNVSIGDWVRINGSVTEFFGLTEIDAKGVSITPIGQNFDLPEPIELESNSPGEYLEGMRVSLDEAIVAGPTFDTPSGCGFSVIIPGSAQLPLIRHSIQGDVSQIIPILPNDDRDCDKLPLLQRGDRVFNLVGPLTWNFDQWKIVQQPDKPIRFETTGGLPLPEKVLLQDGRFSLATLNVENLFDSVDDTGEASEPKLSAEMIEIRFAKFAHLISSWMGCPTLIGIQEVEKASLLTGLAAEIEPFCGFTYQIVHEESYDGRGIDNALLYDPRDVEVKAFQLRQSCTPLNTGIDPKAFNCPAGQDVLFSRPPLEVELTVNGRPLTVLVNHFKSKRGGELETAPRRLAQATFIAGLVDGRLASGEGPVAVVGDFNDYANSPTMLKMIENGNLENVLRRLPDQDQFSFNFGGTSQLIDGILLTADLVQSVSDVQILHLNADYPDSYQLDLTADHLHLKSTDHDPAVVIFDLWRDETTIQQIDKGLGETAPKTDMIPTDVTQSDSQSRFNWLFVLLPLVALLVSILLVIIVGRKKI